MTETGFGFGGFGDPAGVGWVDPDTITPEEWGDVPDDPTGYLLSAWEQCMDFLPRVDGVTVVPDPVPYRLRLAQILQARALYRSSLAGSNDGMGVDGLTVTVFPMDWTVKNLLRPKRGTPVIG